MTRNRRVSEPRGYPPFPSVDILHGDLFNKEKRQEKKAERKAVKEVLDDAIKPRETFAGAGRRRGRARRSGRRKTR